VRVFLSDRGYETLDEDQILDAVRATDGGAEWTDGAVLRHIWRWPEAVPRFPVGSLRCAWLRHPELLHPGRIVFAGDYLAAPHLEGALRSGRAAARTLLARSGDRGACSGLPGRA
jgi:predicted NAD/FAD-dependent oxidoreductase